MCSAARRQLCGIRWSLCLLGYDAALIGNHMYCVLSTNARGEETIRAIIEELSHYHFGGAYCLQLQCIRRKVSRLTVYQLG
jgi:hypothetical protein